MQATCNIQVVPPALRSLIFYYNMLEGIAAALPLYQGEARQWVAFRAAFLSGFAESLRAILTSLFAMSFQKQIPGALALAGGATGFIPLVDEISTAREYGHERFTVTGISPDRSLALSYPESLDCDR